MDNIALVAKTLFDGVWNMLLNTDFPGTDISLAALSLAVMVICGVITIFKFLTGFHMGDATYGRASNLGDKIKKSGAKYSSR